MEFIRNPLAPQFPFFVPSFITALLPALLLFLYAAYEKTVIWLCIVVTGVIFSFIGLYGKISAVATMTPIKGVDVETYQHVLIIYFITSVAFGIFCFLIRPQNIRIGAFRNKIKTNEK